MSCEEIKADLRTALDLLQAMLNEDGGSKPLKGTVGWEIRQLVAKHKGHLAVHANRTCSHSYRLDCACGETGCTKLACLYCMQHKPCEECGGSESGIKHDTRQSTCSPAHCVPCPVCQGVK